MEQQIRLEKEPKGLELEQRGGQQLRGNTFSRSNSEFCRRTDPESEKDLPLRVLTSKPH